jgi:hypothetical protein
MTLIWRRCGHCGQTLPERVGVGDRCPHCGARLAFQKDATPRSSGDTPWSLVLIAFGLLALIIVVGSLSSSRVEEATPTPPASTVDRYHAHVAALQAIAEQDVKDPDRAVSRIDSYCETNAAELKEITASLEPALRHAGLDVKSETWPMDLLCGRVRALEDRATIVKLSPTTRATLAALALKPN